MTMPDLSGMSLRKSIRILQGAGVSITVDGSGRVVSQEPAFGTPLLPDMTVRLTLKQDEVETQ
jgi:beta-lactam-binding protein with PASTA domain